jgi:ADP-ribose pyrophosphatase
MSATLPPHPGVAIDALETVWDGRFPLQRVTFRQRRFRGGFSGKRVWELWRRGRAGAVLPYDPAADAVVLIEQFRLPALAAGVEPVMVEVPAGLCEGDEAPEATIRREAREEAGLSLGRVTPIGRYLLSPGGADECVHLYIGEITAPAAGGDGVAGIAGLAAEEEDIRVRVWPATRAIETALAGGFANVVTALALLFLAAKRAELRQIWRMGGKT